MSFEAKTNEFTYEMHLDAPVDEVFPLLCPVREDDWVIGWSEIATLISSASGLAELGAVFQTQHGDDPPQTWVVTRYEPNERIAFAYFDADVVTRLEIGLSDERGRSRATWTTSHVGISEPGNARLAAMTPESHDASRAGLEVMLRHYLATSEMIDAEELHQRLGAPAHG